VVPGWVRHEDLGGFEAAAWMEPADFALDPRVAECRARDRWLAARVEWLNAHPDVAAVLLDELRAWVAEIP
jgi:hypothetical protein